MIIVGPLMNEFQKLMIFFFIKKISKVAIVEEARNFWLVISDKHHHPN